ncbi:hypothetical protein M9Y10_039370 [Tritrichomonas musculus]|uniref:Protein kinase domain-containing protein n=1 Tax=Tritrichomonas musculus TaxID=1915356 RepID=A0ABR2KB37_9EUKA
MNIFINEYEEPQKDSMFIKYFILCFDYILVIIPQEKINLLHLFFSKNTNASIYCFSDDIEQDLHNLFKQNNLNFSKIFTKSQHKYFVEDIKSFASKFEITIDISKTHEEVENLWNIITECISSFLLEKSYQNSEFDRIQNHKEIFNTNNHYNVHFNQDNFIKLHELGSGSSSFVKLIYHIEDGNLYALKEFYENCDKYFERERKNYDSLHYPLFPRFFGTFKDKKYSCLIIEYIEGTSLKDIHKMNITNDEKMKIIFEIMIIIEYLHYNNFIYRDIHERNFIINNKKSIFMIDFDRMITQDYLNDKSNDEITKNLMVCDFDDIVSFKSDIYLIGRIILFIFPNVPKEYNKLIEISNQCMNEDPKKRPNIADLVDLFFKEYYSKIIQIEQSFIIPSYTNVHTSLFFRYWFFIAEFKDPNSQIKLIGFKNALFEGSSGISLTEFEHDLDFLNQAAEENNVYVQIKLANYYLNGQIVPFDVDKAIYYYTLAADLKNSLAQFLLGNLYLNGQYMEPKINEGIHYMTLAADQGMPGAQVRLGHIYAESKMVQTDMKKAIYYLSLAARNNDPEGQFWLGIIYLHGRNCNINIKKGISYLKLAAKQKHILACNKLGFEYEEGKNVKQNITKSIYYYSISADQNDNDALTNLGLIFLDIKNDRQSINKGIKCLMKASNNGSVKAQRDLALYYLDKNNIDYDVNKSIYYFNLAADNNDIESLYNLGYIYQKNIFVQHDIQKSIYYYSKAAKMNDPSSQYQLGLIYESSYYVARDIQRAIYYFTQASNNNHTDSQNVLGIIYFEGKCVQKDIDKALYYFSLAADKKNRCAIYNLSLVYYKLKDFEKYLYFLKFAADLFVPDALYNLGQYYSKKEEKLDNNSKAFQLLKKAANLGQPNAQYILGSIFLKEQKISLALYYLEQSKLSNAKFILGVVYHEGKYVERDIRKSIFFYKEASSLNNQFAKNNLGVIYENGYGEKIPQQLGNAVELFKEATKKNNYLSFYNLAHLYIYKNPNEDNIMKAINLLLSMLKISSWIKPTFLLYIALALKCDYKYDNIDKKIADICEKIPKSNESISILTGFKTVFRIVGPQYFKNYYQIYKTIDLIYYIDYEELNYSGFYLKYDVVKNEKEINPYIADINYNFYDGFAISI